MTGKELFQEIGNINEEYVAEAEKYHKESGGSIAAIWNRKVAGNASFRRTLTAAACFVVCAGLVFTVQKMGGSNDSAAESARDYDKATVEMAQAGSSEAQNMAAGSDKTAEETFEEGVTGNTEASVAPEAAMEEYAVKENAVKDEEAGREGNPVMEESAVIGNNQSVSGRQESQIDEISEAKSEKIWNADLAKKKMADYPDEYEDILKMEGVYILVHGKAKKGQKIWDAFVKSVDTGETAQAEIIRFTVEGDPIIESVYYDGEVFYLCVDKSRDAYRGSGDAYFEARYDSLIKEEKALEGGGKTVEYCLSDGENEYSIVYLEE